MSGHSQGDAASWQADSSAQKEIYLNKYAQKICFDYSTNDGLIAISLNKIEFQLRFSKESDQYIYVYKDNTDLRAIAKVNRVNVGDDIDFISIDNTSRVNQIPLGGYFIAENIDGYFILVRILSIKDNNRGDLNDEVCFAYRIDASKSGRFKAF